MRSRSSPVFRRQLAASGFHSESLIRVGTRSDVSALDRCGCTVQFEHHPYGSPCGTFGAVEQVDAAVWGQLVYLALFCSVFAFLAQTWAVQNSSASRASLLLGTEPVWAVAFGIGLGGEKFTTLAGLGAALMVTGTYWGQNIERAHRGTNNGDSPGRATAPTST